MNANRLVGSIGPFFRVTVENGSGDTIGLGETLPTEDGPVTVTIDVDIPEWMLVDTVEVYMNLGTEVLAHHSRPDDTPLTPTATYPIVFGDGSREVVATGVEEHAHRTATVTFELESDVDAYAFFLVRGLGGDIPTMFPVVPSRGMRPFAFSNPIYLDADGGGYDNPELAVLAETKGLDELFEPVEWEDPDGDAPRANLIELMRRIEAAYHLH